MSPSGENLYTSKQLERLWPNGYSSVGDVTFGSAAYVARYHLKKLSEEVSRDHYLNPRTGELMAPEFVNMSRRPGIGRGWYDKFKLDMYPSGFRIIEGMKVPLTRFYDGIYEVEDPVGFKQVKRERIAKVDFSDNDSYRLGVKEEVKLAQVRSLSRSLED